MHEVAVAVPGDLTTPTGGYAYDRRVMAELETLGWRVHHVALAGDFPDPSPASLGEARRLFAALPDGVPLLVDGLAYGVLPPDMLSALGRRLIALVHHPLAHETGLDATRAAALKDSETAALRAAAAVIVTSQATARTLAAEFAVPPERITVAPPGVDPAPRATGAGTPPRLLSIGSLVPRKGYDVLVAALERIADLNWQCRIVGDGERSPDTARTLARQIVDAGLQHRVTLAGALPDDAVAREYADADLFVLASHYEGYGMVFTEALARGLPIVACAGGATAQTVPAACGRLVAPGDVAGLAAALRDLLTDGTARRACADAAWAEADRLPRWPGTARTIARILEQTS